VPQSGVPLSILLIRGRARVVAIGWALALLLSVPPVILLINATHSVITTADLPADIRHDSRVVMQAPRRERRRTVAGELYDRIKAGESFWTVAHAPYIARDLAKSDLRELIKKMCEGTNDPNCVYGGQKEGRER